MESGTIVMMVIILSILWGGFTVLLIHSLRVERRRQESASSNVAPAGPDGSSGHDAGGTDV